MKKISLYLFVAAFATLSLDSCSSDPNKLFARKWQVSDFKSKAQDQQMSGLQNSLATANDSASKAKYRRDIDDANKNMTERKKMVVDCHADGTCDVIQSGGGQQFSVKAKWNLIEDGKRLVMQDENSPKSDTLSVDELTEDKLVLSMSDGNGGRVTITYKGIQ